MHPHVTIAHPGTPPAPHDLWQAWSLEPVVLLGLAIPAAAYGLGMRRLGRSRPGVPARRQAAGFAAGLAAVAVALVSPLDTLAEVLFAAHMAQHMLLVMVAAPLLVLGAPGLPLTVSLPPGWRRRLGRLRRQPAMAAGRRLVTRPVVAWGVHVGVLWAWHLPAPY
jgi:putative membrane protein